MEYRIRASRKDDLAAVDALLARSYPRLLRPDYAPSVLVTALPRIVRAQPALVGAPTYYVAETPSGALIGAGGWTRDRQDKAKGHIRHVVVDHRQTRRGIARGLMARSFADAAAGGITELECWSTLTAQPFYASVGFESLGPMDVDLAPGITFPAIRMRRLMG